MGWHCMSIREEFCDHLSDALHALGRASRRLRLASAFAPNCHTRARLVCNRRRVDRIRRKTNRIRRRHCRCLC